MSLPAKRVLPGLGRRYKVQQNEIDTSGAGLFHIDSFGRDVQRTIDAAHAYGPGAVVTGSGMYEITSTITLKYGVSLVGPVSLPFMENFPVKNRFFGLRATKNLNAPMIQNDRVNGPIRQGNQRWQHSTIANVLFDGNSSNQSDGTTAYGIDVLECWGLNIQGCVVNRTKNHAIRLESVNVVNVYDTCVIMGGNLSVAGSHCLHILDIADSDIGAGCQMGGSRGSVVYISKRPAPIVVHNRTWLFKLRDGFFFNSTQGHGIELVDNDTSLGIQIYGNRLDQNYLNGLYVSNSPDNRIFGNVAAMNGFNNETPHVGFHYEGGLNGNVHSDSNYGTTNL